MVYVVIMFTSVSQCVFCVVNIASYTEPIKNNGVNDTESHYYTLHTHVYMHVHLAIQIDSIINCVHVLENIVTKRRSISQLKRTCRYKHVIQ